MCRANRANVVDVVVQDEFTHDVIVEQPSGVRTFEKLMEVRALGVTRVGATATKAILDDAKAKMGL